MANLFPDSLRSLLSQYTFKIDFNVTNEDLTCVLCKKLMIDAYQTSCGCQYCHDCIVNYLFKEEKLCCGGKRECNEEPLVLERNVFRSAMLNRKILKMKVFCPNESCSHSAELTEMEQHLRVCMIQSIVCPYTSLGCKKERDTKDTILTHLLNDPLTHTKLLIEYIHRMKNDFDQLKDDFAMSKLEIIALKEESRLTDIQIEEQKRDIGCMKEELRMKGIKLVELINEVTTLRKDIKFMRDDSKNIKSIVETMDEQSKKYEKGTNTMKTLMVEEMKKRETTDNVARTRADKLEATIEGINIGTNTMVAIGAVIFIVNRFSPMKQAMGEIYSPYFYSHTNGYKLRLLAVHGGNGAGRGTHLSLYIVICKGEYDDLLPWPCKHTFTMSIINQCNKETHNTKARCYSTSKDDCKDGYDKPTDNDNNGGGFPTFISHDDLRSTVGLIVDDSVVIKCVVTAQP